MKNLMILIALSLTLILAACSNTEEDFISPVSPGFDKGGPVVQSFPLKLYQTFPELKSASVSWQYEKTGISIAVNDISASIVNKYLFAIIEYANSRSSIMAFLGDSKSGKYFINSISEVEVNKISKISIFSFDITLSTSGITPPYSISQIFNNLGVRGWSDGGARVKISSYPFPSGTKQLFGQLIATDGSQLIFLGKPQLETFEFPKTEKDNLKDIKLYTFQK